MKVEGRILYIMDVKSGVSKNGKNWKTVDFVVEIPGQYPKKVCFNLFGEERVDTFCGTCNVQDEVVVDFKIDALEYIGKWYNKVSAWKVEKIGGVNRPSSSQNTHGRRNGDEYPF